MGRQRQPGSERRQQIADAALQILGELGVQHLTAMEIARRVGIADGTIFRHFKDKQEIVRAAVLRVQELLFQEPQPSEDDPLDRLRAFFLGRVQLVRRHPGILRVALSDRLAEAAGDDAAGIVRSVQERSRTFVRRCIVEAQERGLVASDVSAEVLALAVVGVLRACALAEPVGGKPVSPAVAWNTLETTLRRTRPAK